MQRGGETAKYIYQNIYVISYTFSYIHTHIHVTECPTANLFPELNCLSLHLEPIFWGREGSTGRGQWATTWSVQQLANLRVRPSIVPVIVYKVVKGVESPLAEQEKETFLGFVDAEMLHFRDLSVWKEALKHRKKRKKIARGKKNTKRKTDRHINTKI